MIPLKEENTTVSYRWFYGIFRSVLTIDIQALTYMNTIMKPLNKDYRESCLPLPNFLIVGAAKSGTTSLYHYLNEHPEIYFPEIKEPHFFVKDKVEGKIHNWVKNFHDYCELFENSKHYRKRGEASVLYLYYYEDAIRNILHYLDNSVKILIIIRNPVERAYSGYQDCFRHNPKENLNFNDALKIEKERKNGYFSPTMHYLSLGLYYKMVSAYLANFKFVKVVIFDDLVNDPEQIMTEIFEFLEIESKYTININEKQNVGGKVWGYPFVGMWIKKLASRSIRDNLKKYFPNTHKVLRKFAYKILMKQSPKMSLGTEIKLKEYFRSDVERLSVLLERDLNHWVN